MRSRSVDSLRARVIHPLQWLWEPLEPDPTFVLRSMFGAKAVYLHGRLMFCFCHKEKPWRGMLVCTERAHQVSLCAEFPALSPHAILGKWLYLPLDSAGFDHVATRLVQLSRDRDARLGIVPPQKKSRERQQRPR